MLYRNTFTILLLFVLVTSAALMAEFAAATHCAAASPGIPARTAFGGRTLGVQAHRGGLGLRPESTLQAFAYALEIGVDVLEMDMVFTKDGIPVIWHDHKIVESKCKDGPMDDGGDSMFPYVGKYIANLTLAQVKTLDCGSMQLAAYRQQKLFPGARIATLEEVLDLVECYGDSKVEINLETKIDPLAPNETLPVSKYITDLIPLLRRRNFDRRTYIQSFDWRTIIGIKRKFPSARTIALLDDTTVTPFDRGVGGYPWLGGINLQKDFNGSFVRAAKFIGASALSPVHGGPAGYTVNSPEYREFVDRRMVEEAHALGMKLVPWTVDDESTMHKLITNGVDAIISNYPERVMYVGRQRGYSVGMPRRPRRRPRCLVPGPTTAS